MFVTWLYSTLVFDWISFWLYLGFKRKKVKSNFHSNFNEALHFLQIKKFINYTSRATFWENSFVAQVTFNVYCYRSDWKLFLVSFLFVIMKLFLRQSVLSININPPIGKIIVSIKQSFCDYLIYPKQIPNTDFYRLFNRIENANSYMIWNKM